MVESKRRHDRKVQKLGIRRKKDSNKRTRWWIKGMKNSSTIYPYMANHIREEAKEE